jgi:hypothetical protein
MGMGANHRIDQADEDLLEAWLNLQDAHLIIAKGRLSMKEYKFIWLYFDSMYRDEGSETNVRRPLSELTDDNWEIMNILSWDASSAAGGRVQAPSGQALLQREKKGEPGPLHTFS